MDTFLAYIYINAGNFAPVDFSFCSGQVIAISENTAVYSLIGSQFGGDGRSTMGLPDLRARAPVGSSVMGNPITPLLPIGWGQRGGNQRIILAESQMPTHTHLAGFTPLTSSGLYGTLTASLDNGESSTPREGDYLGATRDGFNPGNEIYTSSIENGVGLNKVNVSGSSGDGTVSIVNAGSSGEIDITNPYVGVNYVIAMQGLYPSRN